MVLWSAHDNRVLIDFEVVIVDVGSFADIAESSYDATLSDWTLFRPAS